jgi:WhiB family transcriptional regulator, redox-sensing transcriptional regulator
VEERDHPGAPDLAAPRMERAMNSVVSAATEAPTTHRSVEDSQWWGQWASCLGHDPEMWYPTDVRGGAEAVAICTECPVQLDCLGWALEHNERVGIWGGVSAKRRQRIRDEMRLRRNASTVPRRVQPLSTERPTQRVT